METKAIKIYQKSTNRIALKIIPGHFATSHSHINYYIDMTTLKIRQSEAKQIAETMSTNYISNTTVDTIVCMDGCEVIGTYLAEELTKTGIMSMNSHKTLYIVTPEFNNNNQLIFRDNIQHAIAGKHVLLLLASATTGKTIRKCLECISYYGGYTAGVSAIFSAVSHIDNIPINSVFHSEDLPQYEAYNYNSCPVCKNGTRLDAIVNSYGYSKL